MHDLRANNVTKDGPLLYQYLMMRDMRDLETTACGVVRLHNVPRGSQRGVLADHAARCSSFTSDYLQ